MNAKELVDTLRRDADHIEIFHGAVNPTYLRVMADVAELLVPKYRPPQPSDDGRYCFLEKFHKQRDCRPLYVALRDGKWQWYSELLVRWFDFDCGVWPCERPEGGA